jgi:MFS transporter, ACS family, glucarate transporter
MAHDPPASRIRWLLVSWLFVLSAVAYLDRVNLSVAGTRLEADYHLSHIQLGWIFSAFLLGYAAFQTPAGWLADSWGPRRVLSAGVLWWGLFTALTASLPIGIAHAVLLFISIRFLLGAGEAVIYPAANQFVARWIPTQERGAASGFIFAGVGAGAVFALPLVTYIMLHYGWRSSFWICAAIGFAAGFVWLLAARDTPDRHPWVSASELATIRAGLPLSTSEASAEEAKSNAGPIPKMSVPWGSILGKRTVWAITFSYFCFGYVAFIFFGWFYIYLTTVRGLNPKAGAFYTMLPFLAMAAFSPLGGLLSDRLTRRRGKRFGRCGLAGFAAALASGLVLVGSHLQSTRLAGVVFAAGAGALYVSQSSFWSITADIAGPFSGSLSGFMNMGGQIGSAVTASLTPAIASRFGWSASFRVAAVISVLGSLAWLLVDPDKSVVSVSERSQE